MMDDYQYLQVGTVRKKYNMYNNYKSTVHF